MMTFKRKFSLNDWLWVVYPVAVLGFILVTANYFLLDSTRLNKFFGTDQKLDQDLQKISELKQKIQSLNSVNVDKANEDLTVLVKAVPPAKKVWTLVSELQLAATAAGVTVDNYKGGTGKVNEATGEADLSGSDFLVQIKLDSYTQIPVLLEQLEKYVPMVRVNEVKFSLTEAEIKLEGASVPWQRVAADTKPIPNYMVSVNAAKTLVRDLVDLPEVPTYEGGSPTNNPF